ncbi:MAG TPA: hypothetical protein VGK37_11080 [Casimicrobiaceae bacterium]|jgi:hypothetical protein
MSAGLSPRMTVVAIPDRARIVYRLFGWIVAVGCLVFAQRVVAFTFADGTTASCIARGEAVPEYSPPPGTEAMTFTGRTLRVGSGYQIVWNAQKLSALPPQVHDLLFFHECAHAKVPTTDEVQANCVGLKDMRAAGRAGVAVEARLAAFFGATNDYWVNTLRCANAQAGPDGPPTRQVP